MLNLVEFFVKLKYSDLIGVNQEDFNKKCNEAIRKDD